MRAKWFPPVNEAPNQHRRKPTKEAGCTFGASPTEPTTFIDMESAPYLLLPFSIAKRIRAASGLDVLILPRLQKKKTHHNSERDARNTAPNTHTQHNTTQKASSLGTAASLEGRNLRDSPKTTSRSLARLPTPQRATCWGRSLGSRPPCFSVASFRSPPTQLVACFCVLHQTRPALGAWGRTALQRIHTAAHSTHIPGGWGRALGSTFTG